MNPSPTTEEALSAASMDFDQLYEASKCNGNRDAIITYLHACLKRVSADYQAIGIKPTPIA